MHGHVHDFITEIRRVIAQEIQARTYKFVEGTFIAAETEDGNLSTLVIEGRTVKWCRKLEHVTGLAVNDQVLCVHGPGLPVTIVGIITGDITLASASGLEWVPE